MKNLFGAKQSIVNIKDLKSKSCILMPSDKFKTIWTVVIVILLVYTAIFVPFKIAFIEQDSTFTTILDTTVDVLFGVDIIVSFLSAVEDKNGKLVTSHKGIARIYLRGWFWLDFLACFPFQLI
jgi:phosphoglycerol transferase MdoB-like AlkP superfamily enzyme